MSSLLSCTIFSAYEALNERPEWDVLRPTAITILRHILSCTSQPCLVSLPATGLFELSMFPIMNITKALKPCVEAVETGSSSNSAVSFTKFRYDASYTALKLAIFFLRTANYTYKHVWRKILYCSFCTAAPAPGLARRLCYPLQKAVSCCVLFVFRYKNVAYFGATLFFNLQSSNHR